MTNTVDSSSIESGSGRQLVAPTPVLLLHCSAGSGRSWRQVAAKLGGGHPLFTPDLLGYGTGEAWPRGMAIDPEAELEHIRPYLETTDGKIHLVGHSYGGTVAINAARHFHDSIASLTLIEPVSFDLIRGDEAAGWREIETLAHSTVATVAEGRDAEAAVLFTAYWAGSRAWAALDDRARQKIVRAMPKVAAEWRLLLDRAAEPDIAHLARLPLLLVRGALSRHPALAVMDRLAAALPAASLVTLDDAGHLSPQTHADAIAALLGRHFAAPNRKDETHVRDFDRRLPHRL